MPRIYILTSYPTNVLKASFTKTVMKFIYIINGSSGRERIKFTSRRHDARQHLLIRTSFSRAKAQLIMWVVKISWLDMEGIFICTLILFQLGALLGQVVFTGCYSIWHTSHNGYCLYMLLKEALNIQKTEHTKFAESLYKSNCLPHAHCTGPCKCNGYTQEGKQPGTQKGECLSEQFCGKWWETQASGVSSSYRIDLM